jgi:hypothetical protein
MFVIGAVVEIEALFEKGPVVVSGVSVEYVGGDKDKGESDNGEVAVQGEEVGGVVGLGELLFGSLNSGGLVEDAWKSVIERVFLRKNVLRPPA